MHHELGTEPAGHPALAVSQCGNASAVPEEEARKAVLGEVKRTLLSPSVIEPGPDRAVKVTQPADKENRAATN